MISDHGGDREPVRAVVLRGRADGGHRQRCLHLVEVLDVDVGDRQHHDQHDVGQRAGPAGLPFLERQLVEPDRDQLGRRLARS